MGLSARPSESTGRRAGIEGDGVSVTAPRGFAASGVHCGLRRSRPDVAIVRSLVPATGAGMFTVNRVQAAPVVVSREHLELAEPQAVVANSANANAATGERGELDARATAAEAARLLDLDVEEVLLLSTGVIGVPLPLSTMLGGVRQAAAALGADGGGPAAEAILTTDTRSKQAAARGAGFTVGGMAKGSGMIHPRMATMLAVVTTDYPLEPGEAIDFLRPCVDASFNSISVDGDCSTNDTVLLLANGAAPVERTPATDTELAAALHKVCADLAAQIVADGEGVTLTAEIAVEGAPSAGEARAVAERVATSPLVKTALFGRDANWGRILMAAGSARFDGGFARLDPALLSVRIDGVDVYASGRPTGLEPALDSPRVAIELDLGLGDSTATYLTSDLSYEYVRINADYRS
jgi:glutamate N-acetyltransferase / amino-acid N-acetyltransferase